MRIRLWIPLPGPFAITSGGGRSRPRQRVGPYGWVFVVVFTTVFMATLSIGAMAFLWGLIGGVVAVVVARLLVGRHLNRDAARQARLRAEAAAHEARQRRHEDVSSR